MKQALWTSGFLLLYFVAFMTIVLGIGRLIVKRRKSRLPVSVKLLRGPGESLRKRLRKFDEDGIFLFGGAALVPLTVGIAMFALLIWLTPHMRLVTGLIIVTAAGMVSAVPVIVWSVRRVLRNRDDWLGYLGERAVGEYLETLRAHGYYVYHDVPAKGNVKEFNLDHVAIGPSGVALVETKTYSKRRGRANSKDWVVIHDGRRLIWPWGEDGKDLEQAVAEAGWLQRWILQEAHVDVIVKPILAVPGWFVEPQASGDVVVTNEKRVAAAVVGDGHLLLNKDQIARIVAKLEACCRDVEE